jgi:hypothetical protein
MAYSGGSMLQSAGAVTCGLLATEDMDEIQHGSFEHNLELVRLKPDTNTTPRLEMITQQLGAAVCSEGYLLNAQG